MDAAKDRSALGVAYQIPRNTLALLMVAQAAVVLPYLLHLSPWLIGVGLFCGYWRSRVYQGVWDYPGRTIKAFLVVASIAGVALSGVGGFSLEAVSSLLILAFALKLIEMKNRRDAYLVIFLSYFVIAVQFLFDQSLLVAAYELLAIVVVTAALVGLNQLHTRVRPFVSLKLAGTLVLQALPFAVVLFVLFPRVAPLWSVPLPNSNTTGISDRVTPGDMAALTRSDELAFRVVFGGAIPPPKDLYWRGLVYSDFDDGTWSVSREPSPARRSKNDAPTTAGVEYTVLLEPTSNNWLFALDKAYSSTPSVVRTRDFALESRDPILSVFRYDVTSYPDEALAPGEPPGERELVLGGAGNPRIESFARELWQRTGTVESYVNEILRIIREQDYHYTLKPPEYPGPASIDQFWFDGRAGFCTHYASAFIYLMRVVDIPARMVGGYQGGEINPLTGHLVVRQYDAHAWAEIWQPASGWLRVDPTSAVAPQRIERGLNAALSAEDRSSLSLFTNARMGEWGMAGLLQLVDSLEHRWNLRVIGFDGSVQSGILQDLLGGHSPTRVGIALTVSGAISLGIVAAVLFWRRRAVPRHPVERIFSRFAQRLAASGYDRRPEESPAGFVRRVAAQVGLSQAQVGGVVAELETLLYNPGVAWGRSELKALRRQLRRLQFRLAFGSVRRH